MAEEVKKPEKPHRDPKHPLHLRPLDPFVVNLADKDTERYAQVGISLQVDDAKIADEMKAYMPAIKDNIILILSHKSSEELLSLEGKQKMAEEIQRAAARAMGYEVEEPEEDLPEDAANPPKKKKKKRRRWSRTTHRASRLLQLHRAVICLCFPRSQKSTDHEPANSFARRS